MQSERMPPPIPTVTVTEAAARQSDGSGAILVDVRERNEHVELRAVGAVLLPMSELATRIDELPRDRGLLFVCRSGARSGRVTAWFVQQGYADVANVEGGMLAWHAARLPTRSGPIEPDEELIPPIA